MNRKMLAILESHEKFMSDKWGDELLLSFGPGHIVYDDYNVEHESVRYCIQWAKETPLCHYAMFDHCDLSVSEKQQVIDDTILLLEQLLAIPEEECYIWEESDND